MTSRTHVTQVRRLAGAWNRRSSRTVDRVTALLAILGLIAVFGLWIAVLAK